MKKLINLFTLIFIISLAGLSCAVLYSPVRTEDASSASLKAKPLLIVETESEGKISYDDAINDDSVRKIDFGNYSDEDYDNAPKTNYIKEFFSGIGSICSDAINAVGEFWNNYVVSLFLLWRSFLMF